MCYMHEKVYKGCWLAVASKLVMSGGILQRDNFDEFKSSIRGTEERRP